MSNAVAQQQPAKESKIKKVEEIIQTAEDKLKNVEEVERADKVE